MDWFMLTAMVIAGWAVVSVFAGERMVRQYQVNASTAAAAPPVPTTPPGKPVPVDAATGPRLAA